MPISKEKRALYPKNWKEISRRVRDRNGGVCEFCELAVNGQPHPVTGSKVVLTAAHLDHDPTNTDEDNICAFCQRCHNTYDAPFRRANAEKTRQIKKSAKSTTQARKQNEPANTDLGSS